SFHDSFLSLLNRPPCVPESSGSVVLAFAKGWDRSGEERPQVCRTKWSRVWGRPNNAPCFVECKYRSDTNGDRPRPFSRLGGPGHTPSGEALALLANHLKVGEHRRREASPLTLLPTLE